jgi:hypothetical protein
LVIVVMVVFVLTRHPWRKRWWGAPVAAIGITAPWYVWSWFKLGSAVPITLFIKKGQRTWPALGHNYGFGTGPELYLKVFPAATVLSFLPAVLGVLAALIWLVLRVSWPWRVLIGLPVLLERTAASLLMRDQISYAERPWS